MIPEDREDRRLAIRSLATAAGRITSVTLLGHVAEPVVGDRLPLDRLLGQLPRELDRAVSAGEHADLQGVESAPGVAFGDAYYHPACDYDHDGYLTRNETYVSYMKAYTAANTPPTYYGPPRKIRVGLSLSF